MRSFAKATAVAEAKFRITAVMRCPRAERADEQNSGHRGALCKILASGASGFCITTYKPTF